MYNFNRYFVLKAHFSSICSNILSDTVAENRHFVFAGRAFVSALQIRTGTQKSNSVIFCLFFAAYMHIIDFRQ